MPVRRTMGDDISQAAAMVEPAADSACLRDKARSPPDGEHAPVASSQLGMRSQEQESFGNPRQSSIRDSIRKRCTRHQTKEESPECERSVSDNQ